MHSELWVVPRCRAGEASQCALRAQVTSGMCIHRVSGMAMRAEPARHRLLLLVYCWVICYCYWVFSFRGDQRDGKKSREGGVWMQRRSLV